MVENQAAMRERLSSCTFRPPPRAPRASTTAEHLDHIRFVTRNFSRLQGLRSTKLTWALMFLTWGAGDLVPPSPWGVALLLAVLAGMYGGAILLRRRMNPFYRRLGQVEPPVTNYLAVPWPRKIAAIALVGWYVRMLAYHPHDPRCLYVGVGGVLIWLWFDMGRSPSLLYYPALGSLVLAVGAPSRTFGYLLPAMGNAGLANVFLGFVLVIVAVLDHRQLVVTLARFPMPAEEPEHEALAEETP
jgi:hypothetical protein